MTSEPNRPDTQLEGAQLEGAPPKDEREAFQADLSALIDRELDEPAAARAMERLEQDEDCREFFESIARSIDAHRHLKDPEFLADTYRELVGGGVPASLESRQLVHRLATIFYQLGKAYVLAGSDPDWRQRVFERAVEVERTRTSARGFIDGVAARQPREDDAGYADAGCANDGTAVDWSTKRHLLNGTLERIEAPFEKGRRMLDECLAIEPDHDPALLWSALLDLREGKTLRAARGFRRVFDEAIEPANKAHAAMQLGKLHAKEGDHREALRWFRWVGLSGQAARDHRFFPAGFNVGLCWAHLCRPARAIDAFRRLLDRHPDRASEVAGFFSKSPELRAAIDRQPGFTEALFRRCPELFAPSSGPDA